MSRFGEILKNERQRQGLSFQEVSHVTKIQPRILEALENEDWSHLPSRPFVRGFVKNYAKVLGLPEAEVIRAFDGEPFQKAIEIPEIQPVSVPVVTDSDGASIFSLQNLFRFSVVMILMGSVVAIFSFITNYQHEREIDSDQIAHLKLMRASKLGDSDELESEEPASVGLGTTEVVSAIPMDRSPAAGFSNSAVPAPPVTAPAPMAGSQPVSPTTASSAQPEAPAESAVRASPPADQQVAAVQRKAEPLPQPQNQTQPQAQSQTQARAEVVPTSSSVAADGVQASVAPNREVSSEVSSTEASRIVIRAIRSTRVEFEPSGIGISARDLKEGEVYIVRSSALVNLKLTDPRSVEVSVNGRIARPEAERPNMIRVNPASSP